MMDISKLPKWAQAHISALERQVHELKAELALRDDSTRTRMMINSLGEYSGAPPRYGDSRLGVRFLMPHPHDRLFIDARLKGDEVEIMGSGPLTIEPQVSNVIRVGLL